MSSESSKLQKRLKQYNATIAKEVWPSGSYPMGTKSMPDTDRVDFLDGMLGALAGEVFRLETKLGITDTLKKSRRSFNNHGLADEDEHAQHSSAPLHRSSTAPSSSIFGAKGASLSRSQSGVPGSSASPGSAKSRSKTKASAVALADGNKSLSVELLHSKLLETQLTNARAVQAQAQASGAGAEAGVGAGGGILLKLQQKQQQGSSSRGSSGSNKSSSSRGGSSSGSGSEGGSDTLQSLLQEQFVAPLTSAQEQYNKAYLQHVGQRHEQILAALGYRGEGSRAGGGGGGGAAGKGAGGSSNAATAASLLGDGASPQLPHSATAATLTPVQEGLMLQVEGLRKLFSSLDVATLLAHSATTAATTGRSASFMYGVGTSLTGAGGVGAGAAGAGRGGGGRSGGVGAGAPHAGGNISSVESDAQAAVLSLQTQLEQGILSFNDETCELLDRIEEEIEAQEAAAGGGGVVEASLSASGGGSKHWEAHHSHIWSQIDHVLAANCNKNAKEVEEAGNRYVRMYHQCLRALQNGGDKRKGLLRHGERQPQLDAEVNVAMGSPAASGTNAGAAFSFENSAARSPIGAVSGAASTGTGRGSAFSMAASLTAATMGSASDHYYVPVHTLVLDRLDRLNHISNHMHSGKKSAVGSPARKGKQYGGKGQKKSDKPVATDPLERFKEQCKELDAALDSEWGEKLHKLRSLRGQFCATLGEKLDSSLASGRPIGGEAAATAALERVAMNVAAFERAVHSAAIGAPLVVEEPEPAAAAEEEVEVHLAPSWARSAAASASASATAVAPEPAASNAATPSSGQVASNNSVSWAAPATRQAPSDPTASPEGSGKKKSLYASLFSNMGDEADDAAESDDAPASDARATATGGVTSPQLQGPVVSSLLAEPTPAAAHNAAVESLPATRSARSSSSGSSAGDIRNRLGSGGSGSSEEYGEVEEETEEERASLLEAMRALSAASSVGSPPAGALASVDPHAMHPHEAPHHHMSYHNMERFLSGSAKSGADGTPEVQLTDFDFGEENDDDNGAASAASAAAVLPHQNRAPFSNPSGPSSPSSGPSSPLPKRGIPRRQSIRTKDMDSDDDSIEVLLED